MMNHTRRVEVSELQRALAAAAEALAAEKTARRDESEAAAAEIAQLTERLTAAEAPRHSDMSDISWPDISESRMREDEQPDLERGETPRPLVRGAGRWSEELTLFQPWRSHTLRGLSQDSIAYWTDSHEAEFRDGMYHSHFKWRVFMMSSLTFSVCLIVIVEPCLTMLAVVALPVGFLLLSSQIAAHRMVDKRRGRQLGQCAFLLIWIAFAGAVLLFPINATSGAEAPKWNGGMQPVVNEKGFIDPLLMFTLNLAFAPCGLLVGVMITFMTVSTRGFVAMVTGYNVPKATAYLLRDSRF